MLAGYGLVWCWQVVGLPVRVPTHYAPGGLPDRIGSRTEALGQSALLGLALAGGFLALAWVVALAPLERLPGPRLRDWSTPRRRPLRARLLEDVWLVGALTLGFATAGQVATLPALHTSATGQLVWSLVVLYAASLVAWAVGSYRSRWARPRGGAGPPASGPGGAVRRRRGSARTR